MRAYSELISLPTFEERFAYLKIGGAIGTETFGSNRYLNQAFYNSKEWRKLRDSIIVRDLGRDLACEGHDIFGLIVVHHMNPITPDDILNSTDLVWNPEYLIATGELTHKAIHFGDESLLPKAPVERYPNDTCPWRL